MCMHVFSCMRDDDPVLLSLKSIDLGTVCSRTIAGAGIGPPNSVHRSYVSTASLMRSPDSVEEGPTTDVSESVGISCSTSSFEGFNLFSANDFFCISKSCWKAEQV